MKFIITVFSLVFALSTTAVIAGGHEEADPMLDEDVVEETLDEAAGDDMPELPDLDDTEE